ncbi:hypothetical protein B0H11DRAFT_1973580, partial [Mycena galericulata]
MSVQDEEDLWDDVGPSGDYTEAELRAAEALGSLLPENRDALSSSTINSPPLEAPVKRKPGRPKGSRNKNQPPSNNIQSGPKRLGRPPGTGSRQRALLNGTAPPEEPKRPVGRPRVRSPPRPTTVRFGRIHVPGRPPPLRPNEPLDESNTLQMSGGRFITRNAEPTANVTAGSPPIADPPTAATLPPMLQNQEIIQEPDSPSEIIFLEDEDDYTGLLNDGIGDDNDGAASDEEEMQEEDIDQPDPGAAGGEDSDSSEGSTRQAKRSGGPAHALPDWLMNPFKENVAASAPRGKDRLPTLYREHRTFWFPTPDPFFSLEDLDSLAPEQLFSPVFFLWDPDALVPGGIPCPVCGHRLNRHCPIPRPRRCVDLDRTFWIIGYRYRCSNC